MEDNKILEIRKEKIIARELNFDFGCFFYPNERRIISTPRHFYFKKKDDHGNIRKIKTSLYPWAELGILTTFDERVLYCLSEMWEQQKKPEEVFFSQREVANRLKITWGFSTRKAIQNSLNRLRGCGFKWEESFYIKESKEYISIDNPFNILNFLETHSNKVTGIGSQISVFSFDKRTVSNLQENYSRPINLTTILSLNSPLAQSLYTFVDKKLYGTNEYSRTTTGLLIDDLQLIGQSYQSKKKRVQTLKNIIPELVGKRLGYGEKITDIKIESEPRKDAVIIIKRSGAQKIKGKVLKSDKFTIRETENKPTQIPGIPDSTRRVLERFSDLFQSPKIPLEKTSQKVIDRATSEINQHGEDALMYSMGLIKAHLQSSKNEGKSVFEPDTFNGLERLLPRALIAYKEYQKKQEKELLLREEENQKREAAKRELQEEELREKYQTKNFLSLEQMKEVRPEKYEEFELHEQRIWQQEKANHPQRFLATAERRFFKDVNRVPRAVQYFNWEPFEEWKAVQEVIKRGRIT